MAEQQEKKPRRKFSEETRRKMREAKLGVKMSPETKEKIGEIQARVWAEQKAKGITSRRPKGHVQTEEHKEKIRQAIRAHYERKKQLKQQQQNGTND